MTKAKDSKKTAASYLQRLLEDERVHAHVADAAAGLRKAYRRATRQPAAKAAEDKKIYHHVREAVGSLRAAGHTLQRKPERKPKRRGRKLVLLVALALGGALLAKRLSGSAERRDQSDRPAEPVEPGRHDSTTAQPPPEHDSLRMVHHPT
jgi:hypothetical protein